MAERTFFKQLANLTVFFIFSTILFSPVSTIASYADKIKSTDGIVGYWRFEDTNQADSCVNGYTGTFRGGAALSDPGAGVSLSGSPGNRALVLDGSGDYVETSLTTQEQFADAVTMMAWVYLESQPSSAGHPFTIAAKGGILGNNLNFQIDTSNYTKFYTAGTATAYESVLPVQQWIHLTAVVDDTADFRRIYMNSILVADETPMTQDHDPSLQRFSIGAKIPISARFFQGMIDEVAIFNRALTSQEINAIYRSRNFPWILFAVPRPPPSNDPPAPDTATKYFGELELRIVNDVMPKFDGSTISNVEVVVENGQEKVTGTTATLYYDSDENDGGVRIRRTGSITINPVGTCSNSVCVINPMPTGEESSTYWVWDDQKEIWVEYANYTVPIDWTDSEYSFSQSEAVTTGGATVSFNAGTGTGSWTLYLTPNPDYDPSSD